MLGLRLYVLLSTFILLAPLVCFAADFDGEVWYINNELPAALHEVPTLLAQTSHMEALLGIPGGYLQPAYLYDQRVHYHQVMRHLNDPEARFMEIARSRTNGGSNLCHSLVASASWVGRA